MQNLELYRFDPNDVNNGGKVDPQTFDINAFVSNLNITSSELSALKDKFRDFADHANQNLNSTDLNITKLQTRLNELTKICTNECPKCRTIGSMQSQIANEQITRSKQLDESKMLNQIILNIMKKIKTETEHEDQKNKQKIEALTQKFNIEKSKQIYDEIVGLMKKYLAKHPNDKEYQAKFNVLSDSWNMQKIKELTQEFNIVVAQDLHKSKQIYDEIVDLMRKHLANHPNDMDEYQAIINVLSTALNMQKIKELTQEFNIVVARDLHKSKQIYDEIVDLMRKHLEIHPNDLDEYQAKINVLSTSWNMQKQKAQEASAQKAPAQEAPAQEASAQKAPAQEAPAQEASAQEAPAQESKGGNKSKKHKSNKYKKSNKSNNSKNSNKSKKSNKSKSKRVKEMESVWGKNKPLEEWWRQLASGNKVVLVERNGGHKMHTMPTGKMAIRKAFNAFDDDPDIVAVLSSNMSQDAYEVHLYPKAKGKSVEHVIKHYKKYFKSAGPTPADMVANGFPMQKKVLLPA